MKGKVDMEKRRAAVLCTALCVTALCAGGAVAEGAAMSARDIFGIAVDEPMPENFRPAELTGAVRVRDDKENTCYGKKFCGVSPSSFELGDPDGKGRRFVRYVTAQKDWLEYDELKNLCARISSVMKGAPNMERVKGKISSRLEEAKSAAWTGVGADGIPFAVGVETGCPYSLTNLWSAKVTVADYEWFRSKHHELSLPPLVEEGRESRIAEFFKRRADRNLAMMRNKAYSGTWVCKSAGIDYIAYRFDKCGLGCFQGISASGGWFYWTADDKGVITVHHTPQGLPENVFTLRYDHVRNVMMPGKGAYLFSGYKREDNPNCELRFVDDIAASEGIESIKVQAVDEYRQKREKRIAKMKRRNVASFDELLSTAEKIGSEGGVMLRRAGCPEIMVGGLPSPAIVTDVEFIRSGAEGFPKFKCLEGKEGPDIAGKKRREVFFEEDDLKKLAEANGGTMCMDWVELKGIWTREKHKFCLVTFEKGGQEGCRAFLKTALDRWYTFPVEVIELDEEKK